MTHGKKELHGTVGVVRNYVFSIAIVILVTRPLARFVAVLTGETIIVQYIIKNLEENEFL